MSEWRYLAWLTRHEPERLHDAFADVGGLSRGPRPPAVPRAHPDCPDCLPGQCCPRHSYALQASVR